jgi:ankyrin repeat protein
MIAARAGRLEAVRFLLAHGAKPNATAPAVGTALMQASLYGKLDVVTELLAHGADPNVRSPEGYTPLWSATLSAEIDPEVVLALLKAGADANARVPGDRTASVTAADCAADAGRDDVVRLLKTWGARASATNDEPRGSRERASN